MTRRPARWIVAISMAATFGGGCAQAPKAPEAPQTTPSLAMDPCAERLHEIAGMMLQYYAAQRRLPATLAELQAVDPGQHLVCPTTSRQYTYDPKGLDVPGGETYGKLVLYDSVAGHRGMRWGIAVVEQGTARPLVTRIIAVPGPATATTQGATKAPWE